ncbi:MAG: UvrD-helicase domain-containing protein, partial [Sphaerochaetaceae bacterium]|nr:UvrD-helicase domain-containing protein [Sphaerochaetaceae bacterium]
MNEELEAKLLEGLNPQQREAVLINEGALLVFAGAGSGKTKVIATKIAYAIQCLGIKPWEILAVTFTNKACREMQERVVSIMGQGYEDMAKSVNIRTFHSFGVWMLRRYGSYVGLDQNFKIYDEDDGAVLLQQCYPDGNKKELVKAAKIIATLKDKMEKPNPKNMAMPNLVQYYNSYEEKLRSTGNVDFADMILKNLELIQNNSEIKNWVHNRFKMILVDEYQDSNTAQFLLLKEIVGPSSFVCVVGDDDQSIYRFRGAQVKNILD